MEPLSGMNGPLCHSGALWTESENTGELSHEGETEDTPWRHVGTAKVWATASGCLPSSLSLQEDPVFWHGYKEKGRG